MPWHSVLLQRPSGSLDRYSFSCYESKLTHKKVLTRIILSIYPDMDHPYLFADDEEEFGEEEKDETEDEETDSEEKEEEDF